MSEILKDGLMEFMRENEMKFEIVYMTFKTHANIALVFKDIEEAIKVLKNLNVICDDIFKFRHKMHVYNQLGYCYRLN